MLRILISLAGLALAMAGLLPVAATAGTAGVGGPYAEVTWAYQGPTSVSLFNLPNGQGKTLTEAFLANGGGSIDATIFLVVTTGLGVPIGNFPAEDMWIGSVDGGMIPCNGSASADHDTDATGTTVWAEPLFAGGSSMERCLVFLNGDAVTSNGGLDLQFNSADMDGSGVVNLTDAGLFTGVLGTNAYAGDFNFDGVVNVSDAGFMAGSLGASCP